MNCCHVNILSALFKNKFMAGLCEAYESGSLRCSGSIDHLQAKSHYAAWKCKLYELRWVTFCRGSEKRSERIIEYLGRYVLPKGFYKIRYYGLYSNRNKKAKLQLCRRFLKAAAPESRPFNLLDALYELTGIDLSLCPCCHTGKMVIVKAVDPAYAAPP